MREREPGLQNGPESQPQVHLWVQMWCPTGTWGQGAPPPAPSWATVQPAVLCCVEKHLGMKSCSTKSWGMGIAGSVWCRLSSQGTALEINPSPRSFPTDFLHQLTCCESPPAVKTLKKLNSPPVAKGTIPRWVRPELSHSYMATTV